LPDDLLARLADCWKTSAVYPITTRLFVGRSTGRKSAFGSLLPGVLMISTHFALKIRWRW
jgi:hypothetical protein